VTGSAALMLPLTDTIMLAPRSAPLLAASGLAGGVVAVRRRDLEAVAGPDGTEVLVVKGAAPRSGDEVAWCTVAVVAPAVVDTDGRLAVDGWLPDQVRLGVLERHLGAGTVEAVVAASQARPLEPGEEPRQRRERLMSLPLIVRMLLAMTLLPGSSYVEVMAQVVGLLPRLPWVKLWRVPSSTVFTEWRRLAGEDVMRRVFLRVAGAIVAATDAGGLWFGLRVCALDGFQVKAPDSEDNRAAFGSSGTVGGTSGPFPQVRVVIASARAGRALLAAVLDASRVGEMTLAWRLASHHRDLFTPGHIYVLDRNFGSFAFLYEIHRQGHGAHFVVRMKSNVNLPVVERLSDGEYLSYLRLRDGRFIRVRVVEYDIRKPDGTIRSGRRSALLRPAPLRTGLASFPAPGSSKPHGRCGFRSPAEAGAKRAVAGGVHESCSVPVRCVCSSVVGEIVDGYRPPDDAQPPSFPFAGRLRRLVGGEQVLSAQGASTVLPG
jgi:Insertion element 4 transposase N-terminal/Transposase DDE domain